MKSALKKSLTRKRRSPEGIGGAQHMLLPTAVSEEPRGLGRDGAEGGRKKETKGKAQQAPGVAHPLLHLLV